MVPDVPGTARIIAIANQKGGVGKSTTAVSLGAALADIGFRVLVVDLDPQGNASTGLGIGHDSREVSVYDVVVAEAPIASAVVATAVPGLSAVPSTIDLAGAEIELVSQFSRESRLKRAFDPVREASYDFILLDCPPSLGLLTINALTAAEELIVPIQCEYYALEGLGQLLRNVSLVQQNINPGLRLSGIVMTMFDPRTKLSEQVVDEVRRYFGDLVYDVIIPRTVRLSEAPGFGQPITVYDPRSKGAMAYRELAREVAVRPPPERPMPSLDDLPTVVVPQAVETAPRAVGSSLEDEDLDTTGVPSVSELAAARVAEPAAPPDVDRPPDPAPDRSATTQAVGPSKQAEAAAGVNDELATATPTRRPVQPRVPSQPAQTEPTPPEPTPTKAKQPARTRQPAQPVRADADLWDDAVEQPRVRPAPTPSTGHEPRVVIIDEHDDLDIEAAREPLVQITPRNSSEVSEEIVEEIGATLKDEVPSKRRWRLFRRGGE